MALNTKAIKRRIKSVSNTKKITKAMEMISAVKMRKAVASVLATRHYSQAVWKLVHDVAKTVDVRMHPLLSHRPLKRVCVIYITSNRGLAGGFNSRLLVELNKHLTQIKQERGVEVDVILTGKNGRKIFQRFGHTIVAEFPKVDLTAKIDEVLPMAQFAMRDYMEGKYDQVLVAYTDFVSAIQQVPRIKQVLPLTEEGVQLDTMYEPAETAPVSKDDEWEEELGVIEKVSQRFRKDEEEWVTKPESVYTFEPKPQAVLDMLLPRLVESEVYQAVLESDASEHSARMMAMKNATESAKEMIKGLTYSFNKARQAAITQEISEIVGGAAALE